MTERAIRWRDTLLDLANWHNFEGFAQLSKKIDKDHVQVGLDLTPDDENTIFRTSLNLLNDALESVLERRTNH